MASFNPLILSPNLAQKPWVDHIRETLKTQIAVTIDTPPVSIFEIPINLKAEKLEAYVPQGVGLGPNHHFQAKLYHKTEQKKLAAMKKVLRPHQIHDCEKEIVEKVKKIVPLIRDCYDLYHDADDNMLAWLFTIDGMFLIDQLNAYSNHGFAMKANDLIMLENQIPLIVLKEIRKALLGENDHAQDDFLESKFRFFCKSNSSFVLSQENIDFSQVNHLLDYMYNSIINNGTLIPRKVYLTIPGNDPSEKEAMLELVEDVIRFAGVVPGAEPFLQIIEFIMQKFSDILEEKTTAEEIKVPSVSELRKVASVEFRLSPKNEGIRNINFVQGKVRYCYLPRITLNVDSEVVLRNLVAYEKLMANNSFMGGYGLELTEYVDFMCGIMDTAKDVKLLREQKIIEGDLSDEEIVNLFNGIGKSRLNISGESELRKTVAQLNMVYESTPRIWVQSTIEKRFLASAKFITFFITISTAVILIGEVYLTVSGLNSLHMMLARFIRARLSHLQLFFFGPRGPDAII
ncbi:hypothetical protein L1987_49982 [Smallanthus sonchifolius]|uniref:Uncharacterized protein n=1 Tax=Smallanthus sonchifolius TaxID=185202 RepID=A0ACB9FX87_9ASTR|nr:hypothetical protein L1987_49982 [Smallanthus sonchifolius]